MILLATSSIFTWLTGAQDILQALESSIYDTATANVAIYIDADNGVDAIASSVNDVSNPYLTIDRMFLDIPVFMEWQRSIYLAAATNTYDYTRHYTLGFKQARINFYGATSVDASWTISSINSSSRDNGHQYSITGASFTPQEHRGKIVKFTSGSLNNLYGVIYDNDATDIWVTTESTSSTWPEASVSDTLDLTSLDSTISITNGKRNSIRVMRFYNINFTGGWFQGAMSALTYWYCTCNFQQMSAGPDSVHRALCCYMTSNGGALVAAAGRDATIRSNRGTVWDGVTTRKIEILTAGTFAIANECVLTRFPTRGFTMSTDSRITSDEYSATGNTLRFYDTTGYIYVPSGAAGGQGNIPYVAGTIDDDWLVECLGYNYKFSLDGGTVATDVGTNTCTIDGTNESYLDEENGNLIVGIKVNGRRDRYLQTTDATVTDIDSLAVAEGEMFKVETEVVGRKSDGTDRAMYHLEGLFYRNTGGNVTQEGSTTSITTIESDATWNCALVADTGNQTIDVQVTGKAATTVNWNSTLKYIKQT